MTSSRTKNSLSAALDAGRRLARPIARAGMWGRAATSLVAILMAYSAYSVLAVPLLEPNAPERVAKPGGEIPPKPDDRRQRDLEELKAWFTEGDWELRSPKILESRRGKLLLHEYHKLEGGIVEIRPCTMILLPEGNFADIAERNRRAVIVQIPEGAKLKFDSEFDLRQAKVGKLIGGQLNGPITIRSQQRLEDASDDLLVTLRDAELVGTEIRSPHEVDFRLGPNHGHGRDMVIELLRSTPQAAGEKNKDPGQGIGFSGIKQFALLREVELYIQPGKMDLFPKPTGGGRKKGRDKDDEATEAQPAAASPSPAPPATEAAGAPAIATLQPPPNTVPHAATPAEPPVEITCQGAFRFDAVKYVATFEEHVDVMRMNRDGPADQINGEVLSLTFEAEEPAKSKAAKKKRKAEQADPSQAARLPKLVPSRIEVTGSPVIIRVPSNGIHARGNRLEYDIRKETGSLSGPGRLDALIPQGTADPNDRAAQLPQNVDIREMIVTWQTQALFRPEGNERLIAVKGNSTVIAPQVGQLQAEELFVWLAERVRFGADARPMPPRLLPVRMAAQNRVRMASTQLSGEVGELNIWLEYMPPAVEALPPRIGQQPPGSIAPRQDLLRQVRTDRGSASLEPGPDPSRSQRALRLDYATSGGGGSLAGPAAQKQYIVGGELLQMEINIRGTQPHVSQVRLERNASFREAPAQAAAPIGAPAGPTQALAVRGDQLFVDQPQPGAAVVRVIGRPGHAEASGLVIEGPRIALDQLKTHASVEGPGHLLAQVTRDLDGKPLSQPAEMKLAWRERMDFDGLTAEFQGGVTAELDRQRLDCDRMRARLASAVRFDQSNSSTRPELANVACLGPVSLERSVVDQFGLSSIERLHANDLSIDQLSGEIAGRGPGWMTSVHRAMPRQLGALGGAGARRAATPPALQATGAAPGVPPAPGAEAATPAVGIEFLGIEFRGNLSGNQHQRTFAVEHDVRTILGPVNNWSAGLDPDRIDRATEGVMLLTCERLEGINRGGTAQDEAQLELVASGNTQAEGTMQGINYTARAPRLSFEQAKKLIVLEGDGRANAELYRQQPGRGRPSTAVAGKIMYWVDTNNIQVDDWRSGEITDLSGAGGLMPSRR